MTEWFGEGVIQEKKIGGEKSEVGTGIQEERL